MRLIGDAIKAITPNEDEQEEIGNAPTLDPFELADKLTTGEIAVEDIKTIVNNAAKDLGF